MNLLYNSGISLYRSAASVAALGSNKVRHMLSGQKETFGRLENFRKTLAPDGFDVWFHAASLGEFEQARPLIEALLDHMPEKKILLSFFSPSGYEVRCNFNPKVAVVYLPFDTPSLVERFLELASPKMAIFVKYEFWANYLVALNKRGVPTYIISSIFRESQIFFRPWGSMFRRMLQNFTRLYVQDENSRRLLAGIGIDKVSVAGDTRFDRVTSIKNNCKPVVEIETFLANASGSLTLVFGSSWEKDEEIYIPWLAKNEDVKAIIAPHEFDMNRLSLLRRKLGTDRTILFSDYLRLYHNNPMAAAQAAKSLKYIVIDSFGLLSSLYRFADIAYIGGGFGAGIHNINEAAVYGIPVVFGPKHQKFNEARALIACGGGFCVDSAQVFDSVLGKLATDNSLREQSGKSAGSYIQKNIGATPLIMNDIFGLTL